MSLDEKTRMTMQNL